ncbi:MAG: site-2 protease family protein [Burkholderiaceae bacterium]
MDLSIIQLVAVFAIPVIFAITLHEAAHGFVASFLGDPTARLLGRVSANPLKHIDPVGTLLVPGLILLASKAMGGALLFGWAKPVPVVQGNLRSPKRDMGIVAAAGPVSNLIMALLWGIALKLMIVFGVATAGTEFFWRMCEAGVQVNFVLAALNLMPIPPLDGGRILVSLLPAQIAEPVARLEPYGIFILLALLATGTLGTLVLPLVSLGYNALIFILGL